MLDIVICGVGGQGMISLGHILSTACLESDVEFVSAETHGMSQRGGSVIFHFRIGTVNSPLIPIGSANLIVSGEPMEALRYIDYLRPNGIVLTNDMPIVSPVARLLNIVYPDVNLILKELERWPADVHAIPVVKLAEKHDILKSQNMILLGAIMSLDILPMDKNEINRVVRERWPNHIEENLKAIELGMTYVTQHILYSN
jgi:indolepyruvate ferredoxin oxidoreductase beta subunit